MFWDRKREQATLLEHTDLLPEHSTMSLVALGGQRLLAGSTTAPGTGGERKASVAELFIMDVPARRVEWHEPVLEGVQGYLDLHAGAEGLVYGIADRTRFFVFDPVQRRIVHHQELGESLGPTAWQQGPRIFVEADDGTVYLLLERGIGRVDTSPFGISLVTRSPVKITAGGDMLNGRIYFVSGSHLYSWETRGWETGE